MQIYPFVDIVGDDTIQTFLDDPKNLVIPAIQAETIMDWMPDLGQYLAKASCRSMNGLFRTSGLASSGVPALLRHRFAKPHEAKRAPGTHYIGLLIHDRPDDDYVFELSCGADEFGAIKPWRHDNRRHLAVLSRPATILEAFYSFSVRAVGTGPCYLEAIVFLPQLPEGSSYLPVIERLSVHVLGAGPSGVKAQVDFITLEPAAVTITAEGDESVRFSDPHSEKLHSYVLEGLAHDQHYRLVVRAVEPGGQVAEKRFEFSTRAAPGSGGNDVSVALEVCPTGRAVHAGMPLTFGVPFPRGQVGSDLNWRLRSGDDMLRAQGRALSQWNDGSARWILFNCAAPRLLSDSAGAWVQLEGSPEPLSRSKDWGKSVSYTSGSQWAVLDNEHVRIRVESGAKSELCMEHRTAAGEWRTLFAQTGSLLTGRLAGGIALTGTTIENSVLESAGLECAVLRFEVPILDEHQTEHLRATLWVRLYAGQPFARVMLRVMVTSPLLGQAYRSHDLKHITPDLEYARGIVASGQGELTAFMRLDNLELFIPWATNTGQRIHQIHDKAYRLNQNGETKQVIGRWSDPMVFQNGTEKLVLGVREFWQNYPKAIRADQSGVAVEVFPMIEANQDWPEFDAEWWRLYFWLDPEKTHYRLKVGMAFTTDFVLGVPSNEAEAHVWQDWLNYPAAVRPEIDYFNRCKVHLALQPKSTSTQLQYELMMNQAQSEWLENRDLSREYGFSIFGDYYNRVETFWGNNEYDSAFSHWMEFLRGGKPAWTLLAAQATRHLVDIDTCNFSRNPDDLGRQYIHTQGHIGGYLPPQYRNKMGESESLPSHTWVEGAVLQFLMSGDESIRETILHTGLRLTEGLRYFDFNNSRESGWQIIHLTALARITPTAQYTNAAAILVEKVLEKQEPGGGWVHNLSQAHCWCQPPRCRGEAGFMVGVLLSSLRRYHELTHDDRVADAIVNGAKWLVENTFLPEAGLFKYTNCPSRHIPDVDLSMMVVEGLADASLFTQDKAIHHALECVLKVLHDTGFVGEDGTRYGKSLLVASRYIPTMMAILPQKY